MQRHAPTKMKSRGAHRMAHMACYILRKIISGTFMCFLMWCLLIFFYIRWDDDVVFKNCAKGDDGKKKVRHFAAFFKTDMFTLT